MSGRTAPEPLLRGLIDESQDGLVALDERGAILEANLAAATILGQDRDRLIGTPFIATVALADRRPLRRVLSDADGNGQHIDVRFHDSEDHFTLTLRVLPEATRQIVLASITPSDAHGAPAKLASPDDHGRIQRFALRFPNGVVGLRRDGHVAFANAAARRLLGRDGVRVGGPFGEGVEPELVAIARRLTQTPTPVHPTIVERSDGTVLRVSGLAQTADDPGMMFIEDVTAQRRQEQAMREFVRNAAHQFRTPLAGMTAAIETLQRGAKDRSADRDRFLEHLENHAARLTRITRGLLVLARAQGGGQLQLDPVELGPLLDDIAAGVEPHDGVRIETYCEPGLAVLASPELLREALSALAENAATHTHEGTIRLTAVQQDRDVALSVADSGSGILPEFQARIFEPFYRVDDDGKGFGLGLAIAAQAVAAMDGEIEVSGGPDEGTTFTVTLHSATVVR